MSLECAVMQKQHRRSACLVARVHGPPGAGSPTLHSVRYVRLVPTATGPMWIVNPSVKNVRLEHSMQTLVPQASLHARPVHWDSMQM